MPGYAIPELRFVEFRKEETEQSIPVRFEKQAEKYPDHIAIKSQSCELTYYALDKLANLVARAILGRQADENTPVALMLEHDAPAIIAILGALKAGAIFVPIDPAIPFSRIKHILNDCQARLIVTNNKSLEFAERLLAGRHSVINLDRIEESLDAYNWVSPVIDPGHPSWILYTSGSTGQAKGVVQTHRNELHNISHHTNTLCLTAADRLTLLGSYTTGQGMQDIYCALLNGATLYPWSMTGEGLLGFSDWLKTHKLTVYHSAATVFRHFVRNLTDTDAFPDLRIVRLGSEHVSWKDVEAFKTHFHKKCILVNALSCSEARTIRQFAIKHDTHVGELVPVGYSVDDISVLLVDDEGHELPHGQIGNIAVRSRYLSPGYWQDLELTKTVFKGDADQRTYHTGDLGRMSTDGCLEHLGRKDGRIKIHGFRVEMYEIELALLRHPAIDQVFVTYRESAYGDNELIAYLVPHGRRAPHANELREFLKNQIPAYMVPVAFVFLEALPLTPLGKIDRNALPQPGRTRPALDVPCLVPSEPVENALAQLWTEVLGIDEIGVNDNFFDLGGHSLLAMQVVARVAMMFGTKVPLKRFVESPTIGDLRKEISSANTSSGLTSSALRRVQRSRPLPLSFAQQRLWFLDQWQPDIPNYTICRAYYLKGELHVKTLQESFDQVVHRHEILRTNFQTRDGRPVQVIVPNLEIPMRLIRRDESRGLSGALDLAQKEASQSFDLARGPLLRSTLIDVANGEFLFLIVLHQIVCDGWSTRIFISELCKIYQATEEKRRLSLTPLPIQYADFAVWQCELSEGNLLDSQLSYWKHRLGGTLPVADLPTDTPRPQIQGFVGTRRWFEISEHLTEMLRQLSRRAGVTTFITLMAAYRTLLHRYTGQDDMTVGFPIATRNWPETNEVIGPFVNTLVLRSHLLGTSSFKELMVQIGDECLQAYANQDLPFEKLVEELRPERDLSRNPLFQVMFIFQSASPELFALPGIKATSLDIDTGTSKFDLTLSLVEEGTKVSGFFEYSTDLFKRDTIDRMIGHFNTLLQALVADPEQPIATLPILTEGECRRILIEWNETAAYYPKEKCIHQLFEEQVERTPDATALEFDDQQITYGELNRRANQLAHYLITLGIGPEKLVGICVERSIEMVVGLLGILKAGGAYVPLDPGYPEERLRFMLEDADIAVLLTQESLLDRTQNSTLSSQSLAVSLDRDWPVITQQAHENPKLAVSSDNLAYVIYTSGSTGKPKGVQIEHRSVVNCLHSLNDRLGFNEHDVLLAVTTIAFDISVLELFLPLFIGGKVVVASRDQAVDGTALANMLANSQITALQATPSTWRLLLEAGWEDSPGFKILCGGEALPRDLAEALLTRGEVWNLYGPTESTIWSTVENVEHGEGPVLIGRPLANTKIYILDSHLQPVPIGVHGDLYIGGDGLARGYWNNPELTAERFVADPFSDEAAARLYRTGDRARYRPDGSIEFLGRMDNQVKIRGHRIELGEIESALLQHPAVKETVILPFDESASDSENPKSVLNRAEGSKTCTEPSRSIENRKSLGAYIVSPNKPEPSVSELRQFLQGKLPDYMIPSWFLFLDALPLTSNGKLDRNALPSPDGERPTLDQGFVEPRTEIEELVAQVWREVLKRERIGIYDNFFDLGGHSLLATRVVARLRSSFQVDLPLRKLFELPTVAALALHIDALRRSGEGTVLTPIVPVPRNGPLPLSSSQRRLWYLHKVDPNLSAYNIPACFHIKGYLDTGALEKSLNALIARHEVFRSAVLERNGEPCLEIVPTLEFTLPVVDLSHLPAAVAETEVKRIAGEDARRLYELANPPLFRAQLVKLSENQHFLILNFHHIIADGSSLGIFYRELAALYEAACAKKLPALTELPVQYADYAAWQHRWLNSDAFVIQLDYWKRRLTGLPPPIEIPTDFDRSATQSNRGARAVRRLSEELTASIKLFSRQNGATVFMTLFATFNVLLSRITGRDDIVIGSTIAGRNRPETDGLIGFFINALPLRTDLSGDPSFTALLQRVRDACLDAYTHQEIPFEKIVEELKPPREPGHNPLFDIIFNVADTSERTLALSGCEIVKTSEVYPAAKFDIVLHAPEIDGKVELAIVYNTDLFQERRIALLLDQFAFLLEQEINHPDRAISQYSLVAETSRTILPDPTEPLDASWMGAIHEHLAEQARRSPDIPAVVDPDQSWTYGELDQTANRLAQALIVSGIRPGDIVAIYAQRRAALVMTLFGILKAGASFLILDPAYPSARTINYLRIAGVKGWIGLENPPEEIMSYLENSDLRCRLTMPQARIEILQALACYADVEPEVSIGPASPAYVAFTSGSSGDPKGVLCSHGPITHFLPWQKETFELSGSDRFAMLSGLAYSHLHRDVFTAVYLGATISIPGPSDARSPDRLARSLEENRITVLHLTPALGRLLLTQPETRLPALRRVFFGGDVLTWGEVKDMHHLAPNATIGSFYGATETQRAVGYFEISDHGPSRPPALNKPVPLGRGIKDVQLVVLNRRGELAGIGELGEIFVRSPHLASGYLDDDPRTAEMFITNPFTQDPSDRLYRTGELGRYLPDGNIEWAGRNDRRVNIRGYRIELEEVESVLKRHPGVKDAAVVLQEFKDTESENRKSKTCTELSRSIQNPKSDSRLVAYVAAEEESQSLADLLRSFLSAQLPDYMVPAHFVFLDSLPLNPNGKIDYRALPPVEFTDVSFMGAAPTNEIEVKLKAIFAEVLGREDFGITDNFFRLGGHSLLAARAAARIADAFGVHLELSTFLATPTVQGLAKEVAPSRQTPPNLDKGDFEEFDL